MWLLGHKNIKNTLIYTQPISTKDDDYVCKAAKTLDETANLVEADSSLSAKSKTADYSEKENKSETSSHSPRPA